MTDSKPFRLTRAMAARMIADALLVNLALLCALLLRYLMNHAMTGFSEELGYRTSFYIPAMLHNAWLLTVIALLVFWLSGFYTYGRAYRGKYKVLVITLAVGQTFLLFGTITYLFWESLGLTQIPRISLLLAFAIHLGLTLASRTWTFLWEQVIRPEREAQIRVHQSTDRNVLVIGGAGYIGSALLPKLLRRGYRVRVLDMFLYGTQPIASVAQHPRLELVHGDFRHVEKVVEVMRDMDAVVHLGAIVGDPACDLDQDVTIKVNLSATQMIAQVAKASGISRFVFASTCSVYGACDEMLDERSEVRPISLYGKTKLVAEKGLQSMAGDNFTPTILRFATIYGLSGRTRFDLVVNLLAAKAKTDGQITVHGGAQWRPFIHVDDAALGIFKALQAPLWLVGNQVFNVGSDEQNKTIEEIGQMIHEQVIGSELVLDDNSIDKRNYRVSFSKIHNMLNFHPKWTIEQGITQVAEAVANGHVRDYRDAQYSNVKFLREEGVIEVIRVDDDWSHQLRESVEASEHESRSGGEQEWRGAGVVSR